MRSAMESMDAGRICSSLPVPVALPNCWTELSKVGT